MSKRYSLALGPASRRLKDNLTSLRDSNPLDQTNLQDLAELYTTKFAITFSIEKISRTIELISRKDSEWGVYLQSLSGEALEPEVTIYEELASGPQGYNELILMGQERLAMLATYLKEVDARMADLTHKEERQSSIPQERPTSAQLGPVLYHGHTSAFAPVSTLGSGVGYMFASNPASPGLEVLGHAGLGGNNNVLTSDNSNPVPSTPQWPTFTNVVMDTVVRQQVVPTSQSQFAQVQQQQHQPVAGTPFVKLPNTDAIPFFDGEDPLKWWEFWDVFECSIHHTNLPNVQKLLILKQKMVGKAKAAIASYKSLNVNYNDAINTLLKRFGNEQIFKDALYAKLSGLQMTSTKIEHLRTMLDEIETLVRQLKTIGENTDQSALLNLIINKLPPETLEKMEECKKPTEPWSMDSVRETLSDIIERMENVQRITNNRSRTTSDTTTNEESDDSNNDEWNNDDQEHAPHAANYWNTSSLPITEGTRQTFLDEQDPSDDEQINAPVYTNHNKRTTLQPCIFCGGDHYNNMCTNYYNTIDARREKLAELQRCLICLRPEHLRTNCPRNFSCWHCKAENMHNQALCYKQLFAQQGQQLN